MTSTAPVSSHVVVPPWVLTWEWMLRKQWPVSLIVIGMLLVVWEGCARLGGIPEFLMSPTAVVAGVGTAWSEGYLLPALEMSSYRLLSGFVVGTGLGIVLGLLSGTSRAIGAFLAPVVSLANPLPKIALLPVFAVWLGFGDLTRISIIALGCFFPTFLNAVSGTRLVDQAVLRVARNVEAGRVRTFFHVVLPAAMPRVLVGVRISLALSFVVLFASEIVVSPDGVGGMLYGGFLNARYDRMYAGLLVLAAGGFIADLALSKIGARLTHGQSIEAVGRAQ